MSGAASPRRVSIPPDSPFCEGHFPGRPIVPGVALVEIARRAMEEAGTPVAIVGVSSLRFRAPVTPGVEIEILVTGPDVSGETRVRWGLGAETVATASLRLGRFSSLGPPGRREAASGAPVDAARLLPHRPPSRLVASVVGAGEGVLRCEAIVPAASPFRCGDRAPSFLAIEIAAQSAAAMEALARARSGGDGEPRRGYLVGARDVALTSAHLPVGEPLLATVRLDGAAPPLSTYAFEVLDDAGLVARGTISTWLTATGA